MFWRFSHNRLVLMGDNEEWIAQMADLYPDLLYFKADLVCVD